MDIAEFLKSINDIEWFSKSGSSCDKYIVIQSLFEAYDNWNDKYMNVWQPKIQHLEEVAQNAMGDKWIDECFSIITSEIGDLLWSKWEQFIISSVRLRRAIIIITAVPDYYLSMFNELPSL